jgi:regulator of protease activity HflC (stomatin/prohibitin superfamily)
VQVAEDIHLESRLQAARGSVIYFMITYHSQVLSRDSVTVNVDAVVFYSVNQPIMATNNVEDYR